MLKLVTFTPDDFVRIGTYDRVSFDSFEKYLEDVFDDREVLKSCVYLKGINSLQEETLTIYAPEDFAVDRMSGMIQAVESLFLKGLLR